MVRVILMEVLFPVGAFPDPVFPRLLVAHFTSSMIKRLQREVLTTLGEWSGDKMISQTKLIETQVCFRLQRKREYPYPTWLKKSTTSWNPMSPFPEKSNAVTGSFSLIHST